MALFAQAELILLTVSLAIIITEGLEVARPNCTVGLIMPLEPNESYWEANEKIIFSSVKEAQKKKVSEKHIAKQ